MSDELSREELEWLSEIVYIYREDRDWTQNEWAELETIINKLDAKLEAP
jgi:hypothetical protein